MTPSHIQQDHTGPRHRNHRNQQRHPWIVWCFKPNAPALTPHRRANSGTIRLPPPPPQPTPIPDGLYSTDNLLFFPIPWNEYLVATCPPPQAAPPPTDAAAPDATQLSPSQAEAVPGTKNTHCVVCGPLDGVIPSMILCNVKTCHAAFHPTCLNPPLHAVPPGGWFCPCCEVMHGGVLEPQPALLALGMALDDSCPPHQPALPPRNEPAPPPRIPPPLPWRPHNARGRPPPPAAEPSALPQKRPAPITLLPHHYCSHCWALGSHWTTECPDKDKDPVTRPDNFTAQLHAARSTWRSQIGKHSNSTRSRKKERKEKLNNTINNPNPPPDYEP